MAPISKQIAELVDILPVSDQQLAYELVRKLVLAWDPDFTKATKSEAASMEEAEREIERGETVSHNEIDWN